MMNTTIGVAIWALFFYLVRAEPILEKVGYIAIGVGMTYIHTTVMEIYEGLHKPKP